MKKERGRSSGSREYSRIFHIQMLYQVGEIKRFASEFYKVGAALQHIIPSYH